MLDDKPLIISAELSSYKLKQACMSVYLNK